MKVEILHTHKNELYDELEYELFLSLFEQDQPLLSSVILHPMANNEALSHYARLARLEQELQPGKLATLLKQSTTLPPLDHLLHLLDQGQLEQYHFFELGSFLHNDTVLCSLEESCPLDPKSKQILDLLLQILEKYMGKSFSTMRVNKETEEIRAALAESKKKLGEAVKHLEQQIFECTSLKMTYPWPRELALSKEQIKSMGDCDLLAIEKRNDIWLIDYDLSLALKRLQSKKNELNAQFDTLMQKQLKQLNSELSPLASCFKKYYRKRVKRTWHYVLLGVKQEKRFCLPEFTTRQGCRLKDAYLYGLKVRKEAKCIPLDLSIGRGATVLYGANMSGKTTVLKTVYCLLTLVQLGLPLPARKAVLHYPEQVALMLKSPGDVRTDSSTYGEELAFFARPMNDGAYILSDELFLSTDPANGVVLSKILIRSMARADKLFFCTTHYPEILDIENITLYRMADPDPLLLKKNSSNLQSLQNFMPYKLIPITDREQEKIRTSLAPLETALLFDLPQDIKKAIRSHLAGITSSQ
jgi:DNA mismatch repair ATPase MutS